MPESTAVGTHRDIEWQIRRYAPICPNLTSLDGSRTLFDVALLVIGRQHDRYGVAGSHGGPPVSGRPARRDAIGCRPDGALPQFQTSSTTQANTVPIHAGHDRRPLITCDASLTIASAASSWPP